MALCKHCRAEPDSHDILDGRSELADFRSKAQESVKDVVSFGQNKLEFIHFNLDIHYWFSGIASSIDGIAEQFRQLGPNGGNSVHY